MEGTTPRTHSKCSVYVRFIFGVKIDSEDNRSVYAMASVCRLTGCAYIVPAFHRSVASGGATQHFITGSGGFIQAFVFGYSAMRIGPGVLTFAAKKPEL